MESIEQLAAAIPQLVVEVPNRRNWFSLRLQDLSPSLADDINSWQMRELGKTRRNAPSGSDRGRPSGERRVAGTRRRRAIRPSSAQSYLRLLLSFITMEVEGGIPLDSLRTLADVVDLDNVDTGLAAYEKHFKGIKRRHLGQVMRVVCIIAGHWVRVEDDHLEELRAWTTEVSSDTSYTMSERTKEAVRALRDPRLLGRLLTEPERVFNDILSRGRLRHHDAVQAQAAFTTQLILNAPARIDNASRVHLDLNIRRIGTGRDQRVIVEFPAASVQTGAPVLLETVPKSAPRSSCRSRRLSSCNPSPGSTWCRSILLPLKSPCFSGTKHEPSIFSVF